MFIDQPYLINFNYKFLILNQLFNALMPKFKHFVIKKLISH